MKIILFGEDIFSAVVLQSLTDNGYTVTAIVCPIYKNSPGYQSLEQVAKKNSIPFFREVNINGDPVRENVIKMKPDLIVCVHLRKILLKEIYSLPPRGAINIHPSLLPQYRGLSPQHQALMHGDSETGVTVHYIDETPDTGDIIIQEKIKLTPDTYIYDLQLKMLSIYKYLVKDAIQLISENNFHPLPQKDTGGSWFGSLKDSDRRIDTGKTKFATYNLIRAVSKPYKGAYYDNIIIWTSFFPDAATEKNLIKDYPGKGIYTIEEDKLLIRLEDGVLLSDDFEIVNVK